MLKKTVKISIISFIILLLVLLAVIVSLYIYYKNNVNTEYDELLFSSSLGSSVTRYYLDKTGANIINTYKPEFIESSDGAEEKRLWYRLDELPDDLISAFISAEDRKFFSHRGVDIRRTVLAALNSVFHFDGNFGASTITQQLIKNISGDNEVTLRRKLKEIMRAVSLERNHTKEEILELYLNIVPMGENLAGVGIASKNYFGKEPKLLTLEECATLAAITNAPTRYNPHENPELCEKKRNDVLYAMLDFGVLNEDRYKEAIASPLRVTKQSMADSGINSWFSETVDADVIDYLIKNFGYTKSAAERLLYSGGLSIYTTMDKAVQNTLEKYFEDKSNFPSDISSGLEFAMTVVNPKNGDLLGIVGAVGKKQANRLLNLATTPHTPGSAMKPLALYAPLIDEGKINAATIFDDVPIRFDKNIPYPRNYPSVYAGLTTVKDAIRLSKNTVAVKLYEILGAERIFYNLKNDFGFDTLVRRRVLEDGGILSDLASSPLALGQLSYGVSLRRLTEAYSTFANDGVLAKGRSFVAVYDGLGNLLIDNSPEEKVIYKRETARIMNSLLMNVTESGTASQITLKNLVDTAGKTGTSGDDKDRLFVGYTPYFAAGIWCGYRDGGGEIGKIAPTHLKIWDNIMTELHNMKLKHLKDERIDSFSLGGLVRREFCMDSGELFTPDCALDPREGRLDFSYFTPDNLPEVNCHAHKLVYYDKITEAIACPDCPKENLGIVALIKVPQRSFPVEIIISDAEYVYKKMKGNIYGDISDIPYFYYELDRDKYVGRSRRAKQFNSYCYHHSFSE